MYRSTDVPDHDLGVLDLRSVVALAGTLRSELRHGWDRVVLDRIRS